MRHLHWFRNDLRLSDNPAIASHTAADSLLCVYLMPKPRPWCNLVGVGAQRERFLRESLQELHLQLAEQGQALMVLEGSPELVLPDLVARFAITEVSTTFTPGSQERKTLAYLDQKLPVPLQVHRGNSLFEPSDLPFELEDLPKVFSGFRRAVEKLNVRGPSPSTEVLPPPPAAQFDAIPPADTSKPTMLPLPGAAQQACDACDSSYLMTAQLHNTKRRETVSMRWTAPAHCHPG